MLACLSRVILNSGCHSSRERLKYGSSEADYTETVSTSTLVAAALGLQLKFEILLTAETFQTRITRASSSDCVQNKTESWWLNYTISSEHRQVAENCIKHSWSQIIATWTFSRAEAPTRLQSTLVFRIWVKAKYVHGLRHFHRSLGLNWQLC
jgi:hypothetical protein